MIACCSSKNIGSFYYLRNKILLMSRARPLAFLEQALMEHFTCMITAWYSVLQPLSYSSDMTITSTFHPKGEPVNPRCPFLALLAFCYSFTALASRVQANPILDETVTSWKQLWERKEIYASQPSDTIRGGQPSQRKFLELAVPTIYLKSPFKSFRCSKSTLKNPDIAPPER